MKGMEMYTNGEFAARDILVVIRTPIGAMKIDKT
jgi:hypothetical protein